MNEKLLVNDKPRIKKYFVIGACLVAVLICSLLVYNFAFRKDYWDENGANSVIVSIPNGSSSSQIADILVANGVILDADFFIEQTIKDGVDSKLQAGSYNLKIHQSSETVIAMLMDANNKVGYKLTIPEGYTANDIIDYVVSVTNRPKADIKKGLDVAKKVSLPKQAKTKSEGWLFPATYTIPIDMPSADIFKQMIAKTLEVLQSHNLPSDRWQETLTKASIVQKEVSGHDYYGKVARVIDNRLSTESTNGLLGMDTVIAYGLGINAMNLTKAQLDDDTNPYNDRIHAGLPPSPISNPGQDAIEAVINPPEGDWIYFCTVNLKTGDTRFTNSSLEFDKYKAEYENWLKQNPNFDED